MLGEFHFSMSDVIVLICFDLLWPDFITFWSSNVSDNLIIQFDILYLSMLQHNSSFV